MHSCIRHSVAVVRERERHGKKGREIEKQIVIIKIEGGDGEGDPVKRAEIVCNGESTKRLSGKSHLEL